MSGILGILGMVCGLGCLICCILVLVKLFQAGETVHAIIGIVTCGIWAFIWGWISSGRLNIRNIMMIWTLLLILSIILNIAGGGFHYSFGGVPATP